MGIEHFRRIFDPRFGVKQFAAAENVELPSKIMSVFIDCNGIFHNAKRGIYPKLSDEKEVKKVKKKYSKSDLKEKYLDAITDKLDQILDEFKPTHNFIIAPDGVANAAKLNQQKTRRFKPTDPREEVWGFDGRALTPGTEIMFQIDRHIKKWLKNHRNLPPNTIYSSHMDPGEGEHKIFQFVRDKMLIGDVDKGNHIVYGADGDLYILSVLCDLKNIYLHRDDEGEINYDIDKFRDGIYEKLYFDRCEEKLIFQDFALMSTFVGNDFIPKMPNLPGTFRTLMEMFKIYSRVKLHLTDEEGEIVWEHFSQFIRKVNSWKVYDEDLYLYTLYNQYNKLRYPAVGMIDYVKIKEKHTGKTVKWMERDYDPGRDEREFDRRGFEKCWYDKQFKPIDPTFYKRNGEKEYYTKKDIFNMCVDYLKIMQWFLYYYVKGYRYVSQHYFYPYRITPLTHNLNYYLRNILERGNDEILMSGIIHKSSDFKITPVHQLLSVLPPNATGIIPKEFRPLYNSTKSVNPSEYLVPPPENTNAEHHIVPLVPPINLDLINFLIVESEIIIPKKYSSVTVLTIS